MIASILAFSCATALASAWHGGNHHSKGYIIASHIVAALLINPVTVLSVALFWGAFRRSHHAIAELDYLSFEDDEAHAKELEAVRKAYPKPIGSIIAKAMAWLYDNEFPVFDALPPRRKQELVGGFLLGFVTSAPLIAAYKLALWGL